MAQADARVVLRADVAEVVRERLERRVVLVIDVLGSPASAERTRFAAWVGSPLNVLLVRHACLAVAVSPPGRGRNERKKLNVTAKAELEIDGIIRN